MSKFNQETKKFKKIRSAKSIIYYYEIQTSDLNK